MMLYYPKDTLKILLGLLVKYLHNCPVRLVDDVSLMDILL